MDQQIISDEVLDKVEIDRLINNNIFYFKQYNSTIYKA